ncbi:MAG: ribose-phosphate pyrophosphokinase [Candidatus Sumerlaeia bacterium]|nr:ribose-phosphate pyrophosphokinase [Candidatus Sumerlaeia bacterium]
MSNRPSRRAHAPQLADPFLGEPPVILPGSASIDLASEIAKKLGTTLGRVTIEPFSDGETFVKILDNVRGRDVFVIQSTSFPANEHIMQLLLLMDAARRASAQRVTAVIPYFGYARQDRKDQGRVALSAKLVANLIATAGADRLLTVDLHANQLQGFFDMPVDHLLGGPALIDYVRKKLKLKKITVVSPDVGNVKMARNFANQLDAPLAIVDKRRPKPNVSEVMSIIGEEQIAGRDVCIFDDMIDTAGTICNAARAVCERGALDVYALCSHAVLSGTALERLADAPIKQVVVTNTIHHDLQRLPKKVKTISIAPLLAQAIDRIHTHRSVSDLFSGKNR